MASTTLFAPQIRSVQPAFVYNRSVNAETGEVTITATVTVYFTPSPLNDMDEDVSYILYSIIDPSLTSTWGSNSMFKGSQIRGYINKNSCVKDDNTNEYYFTFSISATNFKDFSTNKYYQLQLYFEDTTAAKGTAARGTQSWLTANADRISESSQPSLLRPIDEPIVVITTEGTLSDFSSLNGYVHNDAEPFESCSCTVYKVTGTGNQKVKTLVYTSPTMLINGKYFSIPIDNNKVAEGGTYDVQFTYLTKHGYGATITKVGGGERDLTFIFNGPNQTTSVPYLKDLKPLDENGAIQMTISLLNRNQKIQRKSNSVPGWQTLFSSNDNSNVAGRWIDYTVESGESYQYRLLTNNYVHSNHQASDAISSNFEEIFLSNKDAMVAIRYNPNISGFKYVTQESITNTLGGQYPIIRKNGDTRYRQFTISGIIDNSCAVAASTNFTDSTRGTKTFNFDSSKPGSLYVINTTPFTSLSDQKLEREIRRVTMDFLTDSKPKLFRSFEEGNMIVYLSNISFTPNKTFGRHIYDFSATVTEMCEYNGQNLEKYELNLGGYTKVTKSTSGGN